MPPCNHCGEIVDNADDQSRWDVLRFCMVYNVSPKELVDISSGRFTEIIDAYENLPDDAKSTILDLAAALGMLPATSSKSPGSKLLSAKPKAAAPKPKSKAKKPASKKKGKKK